MNRKFISRRRSRISSTGFVVYEGEGVFGTGIVQNFSVDGWQITTIEPRPIHVGMSLALRVTLPNQPITIHVEAATVQWVRGREFGIQVVSRSSEGDVEPRPCPFGPSEQRESCASQTVGIAVVRGACARGGQPGNMQYASRPRWRGWRSQVTRD
jgi:hypothetical protein